MSEEIFTVLTAENMKNWKLFILINSRDHFLLSDSSGSIWQSDAWSSGGKLSSHPKRNRGVSREEGEGPLVDLWQNNNFLLKTRK